MFRLQKRVGFLSAILLLNSSVVMAQSTRKPAQEAQTQATSGTSQATTAVQASPADSATASAQTTSAAPVQVISPSPTPANAATSTSVTATANPTQKMPVTNLKPVMNSSFNRPLKYVDQVDQTAQWTLDYDLETDKGDTLKFGPVSLDPKSFTFKYGPLTRNHPAAKAVFKDAANEPALLVIWPEVLFASGVIEMISKNGDVLWKHEIKAQELNDWRDKKAEFFKSVKSKSAFNEQNDFPILKLRDLKFPVSKSEVFRFCLSQGEEKSVSKLCGAQMGFRKVNGIVSLARLKSEVKARALVRNENAKLKDTLPVSDEMPTSFYAELNSGISYEFVSMPPLNKISDVLETKDPNAYQVQGWDLRPAGKYKVLNPDEYGSLTKAIGFQPTIGDFRKFWSAEVNVANPYLWIPADSGGVFRRKVSLDLTPKMIQRPYLASGSPTVTYAEEVVLRGRRQRGTTVKSSQSSIQIDAKNKAEFDWTFAAPETNAINRSYLTIESEGRSYKSYYEIYRGLPNELSGRFTGVAGSNSLAILAEVAYNHWFETLFGWNNDTFSRHRWGLSGKYFQSLNKIQLDATRSATLNVLTLDAKYRFSAGLWGRDETTGAIFSYQNVTLETISAPMLGVGGFWARSMPRVFDNLFNYFSIFQYPKWVDMELIYYVSPMSTSVTLESSFALNFHGQVMWTEQFFGEAGFGLKRYGFTDTSVAQKAALNTFYGTFGIGYKF